MMGIGGDLSGETGDVPVSGLARGEAGQDYVREDMRERERKWASRKEDWGDGGQGGLDGSPGEL
jgi:hypothetical protein